MTNRNGKAPPICTGGVCQDNAVALSHNVPTERDAALAVGVFGWPGLTDCLHKSFGLKLIDGGDDVAPSGDETMIPDGLNDFLNGESVGKANAEFLGRDVGFIRERTPLAVDGSGDLDGGEDAALGEGLLDESPHRDRVADVLGGGSAEDVVIRLEGTSGGEGLFDELFAGFHAIWIYGLGNRRDEYTYSLRNRKGYFDVFSEEPRRRCRTIYRT